MCLIVIHIGAMHSLLLIIIVGTFCLFIPGGYCFQYAASQLARHTMRLEPLKENDKNLMGDIVDIKKSVFGNIFDKLRPFLPIIAFYVVMNLPIYGVGVFSRGNSDGFGSMTDFSTVKNRGTTTTIANEYLVAPAKFAPYARVVKAPEYSISEADLAKVIDKVVMRSPRISKIATDADTGRMEYVQRTLLFRFPDVITFQPIALSSKDSSSVAIHSYSIYGAGDLGVNAKRVKAWMSEIHAEAKKL